MNIYQIMDIYNKWKELLSDSNKRTEWIEFYIKNDPTFSAVVDFCNDKIVDNKVVLELALIAILDEKITTLTDQHKMSQYKSSITNKRTNIMTMPHLMNCEHSNSGWCLDCVGKLYNKQQSKNQRECLECTAKYESSNPRHRFCGEDCARKYTKKNGFVLFEEDRSISEKYNESFYGTPPVRVMIGGKEVGGIVNHCTYSADMEISGGSRVFKINPNLKSSRENPVLFAEDLKNIAKHVSSVTVIPSTRPD